MRHFSRELLWLMLLALAASGCVSKKSYDELLDSKARTDRENIRLNQVEQDFAELKVRLNELLSSLDNTEDALSSVRTNLENLNGEYSELQNQYDQLLRDKQTMTNEHAREKADLTALLTVKQSELDDKERIVRSLEKTVYANQDELAAREQSIKELNTRLIKQQEGLDSLKNSISRALLEFSSDDLNVEQRGAKIYISLSQNLLFEKNSKSLDAKGRSAIGKVANVLVANPQIEITVEGHTDTDGDQSYNWDLSVSRATAVVRELIRSGLDGQRVTAAGRAYFDPVDGGTDEAAKSRNRRTEIILSPRLREIFELIQP